MLKMSPSLFIRLLEWAKEEASDDVDLHVLFERLEKINSQVPVVEMKHYRTILGVPSMEQQIQEKAKQKENMEGYGK